MTRRSRSRVPDDHGVRPEGWQRPAGYYISTGIIGFRFVLEGDEDTRRFHGWRPTQKWAKRSAKGRLRARTDRGSDPATGASEGP